MKIFVKDNNVDQALRFLKKKMQREGLLREMKAHSFYEKPSEKRVREKAEAMVLMCPIASKAMDTDAGALEAAALNANVLVSDVDWFIPHQANQRILDGVAQRLGLDEAKVVSTVAMHANTSAASIPLALDVAVRDGRIRPGQLLLMEAMGGGLTWGAAVLRF